MSYAKTAVGLKDWAAERCSGQFRMSNGIDLGLPDMSLTQAADSGVKTVVIGVAPVGGGLPGHWIPILVQALDAGMDIAAGLHTRIAAVPELAEAAERSGASLHDVRVPNPPFPIATGKRRTGHRLLTVGTDCACGKKYTALAIASCLRTTGISATFRATGQTGILIEGTGVPIDSVVADFLAGAAESLSPDNHQDHWDIIEGQGSLFHPAYAGVTTGLIHGSQPDAMVLCHEVGRDEIYDYPGFSIPSLEAVMDTYLSVAKLTNPKARFVGMAFNTSTISESNAQSLLQKTADSLSLPCTDPFRFGVDPLMPELIRREPQNAG